MTGVTVPEDMVPALIAEAAALRSQLAEAAAEIARLRSQVADYQQLHGVWQEKWRAAFPAPQPDTKGNENGRQP